MTIIQLTAAQAIAIRHAMGVAQSGLISGEVRVFNEETGAWQVTKEDGAHSVHMRCLASAVLEQLHKVIGSRRPGSVAGVTWTPGDDAAGMAYGGEVELDRFGEVALQNALGLCWQYAVCQIGLSQEQVEQEDVMRDAQELRGTLRAVLQQL